MTPQFISQSTKVENCRAQKRTRSVHVDAGTRACINCIWYEQYYRTNRGNIVAFVPACAGNCLLHDRYRSPIGQTCKHFEMKIYPPDANGVGQSTKRGVKQ